MTHEQVWQRGFGQHVHTIDHGEGFELGRSYQVLKVMIAQPRALTSSADPPTELPASLDEVG